MAATCTPESPLDACSADLHSLSSLSSISSHPLLPEAPPSSALCPMAANSLWLTAGTPSASQPSSPTRAGSCSAHGTAHGTTAASSAAVLASFVSGCSDADAAALAARDACSLQLPVARPSTPDARRRRSSCGAARLRAAEVGETPEGVAGWRALMDEQRCTLRSAHDQARDAHKGLLAAHGQRLVSDAWLAGNFAALDALQGNLDVLPTSPRARAGDAACSRPPGCAPRLQGAAAARPRPGSAQQGGPQSRGSGGRVVSPRAHALSTVGSVDTGASGRSAEASGALARHASSSALAAAKGAEAAACMHAGAGEELRAQGSLGAKGSSRGDASDDDIMLPQSPRLRLPAAHTARAHQAGQPAAASSRASPTTSRRAQVRLFITDTAWRTRLRHALVCLRAGRALSAWLLALALAGVAVASATRCQPLGAISARAHAVAAWPLALAFATCVNWRSTT